MELVLAVDHTVHVSVIMVTLENTVPLKDQEQSLITEYIQLVQQLMQQLILTPTHLTLVTMVVNGIMRIKDAIVLLLTGVRHILYKLYSIMI